MYKMKQVLYPAETAWTEHFYDGQIEVVNNIAEVKHEHWRDALYLRGFRDIEESNESPVQPEPEEVKPTPRKRGRPRKED